MQQDTSDNSTLEINYIEETPEQTPLTAKELFDKLCNIHREIDLLKEDEKALIENGKASSLDTTLINKIAKAYVKDKLEDLEKLTEETLEMIQELS